MTDDDTPLGVGLLAVAVLAAHIAVNLTSPYGFHRDEFLYLAMGRHLRLWAMDFPPFIAIVARATLETIGGWLVAVRLLPAVVHALLVLLSAYVARRLGGGGFAQGTAALAVVVCPLFMRAGNLFQPVVFDQLWWTLALVALIRVGAGGGEDGSAAGRQDGRTPGDGRGHRWLLLGLVLGLGLLTKYSIAFIGIGIVAGVLLTPLRRWLLTPWPWLAALLAIAVGSPSIVGQIRLGWPVAAQMADLRGAQLERIGPLAFITGNLEFLGPLLILAVAGVAELLRRSRSDGARAAGFSVIVTFLLLLLLQGKAYYIGPIYPLLFGAGATWLERLGRRSEGTAKVRPAAAHGATLLRVVVVLLILLFGAVTLPFGLPFMPPERMASYAALAGRGTETNTGERIELPQDYADMLGWEAQAAATARVYRSLPPRERQQVVVIGTNYGRAGAHDHLAVPRGLPPAVAPVGSYWFFGPGDRPGNVAIVIGDERQRLEELFEQVTLGERITSSMRVPEERDVSIWIARRPRATLQELWPRFEGQN